MHRRNLPGISTALAAAVLLVASTNASALDLSGPLSDSTTGPIPPGVHRVIGNLTVPAGQTLTIQPGAILKFNAGLQMLVSGTLIAAGTAGQPISFTSHLDDSAGGDTNGDGGATSPSPGNWRGILLAQNSTGTTLSYCDIRYHGSGGWSGIYVNGDGAQATITDSSIRDGQFHGIDANTALADLSVSGCSFTGNVQYAVHDLRIEQCPGFENNTATGNGGNYMRVVQPDPSANVTIEEKNCLGGALVFTTTCNVPSGVTLTLKEGVVIKILGGASIDTQGSLVCLGTVAKPVVFTAFADDDHGGDTNGDGPSNGAPGSIRGLIFAGGSTGNGLDHVIVRYAGSGGWSCVYLEGAGVQLALTNSTLRDSSFHGLDANQHPAALTVTDCSFIGNAQLAVEDLRIDHVPGFANNTASGNGKNNMTVSQPDPTASVTIEVTNCLGGALVFPTTCNVPVGVTLTLKEGVVIKLAAGTSIDTQGSLVSLGTDANPVVVTALSDDDHAGDTNGDGPSSGAPGSIRGLIFGATSTGNLIDHTIVRYGGGGGWSNVYLEGAGVQAAFVNSTFADSSFHGFDANGHAADVTVTGCSFVGNAQYAVEDLHIALVPGFSNNVASGNGVNAMLVSQPDPAGPVSITADNCLEGALIFATSCNVGMGASLSLDGGVIVKFASGATLRCASGAIHLNGVATNPVVLTALTDDEHGGDTNGDGSTTVPTKGYWQGIRVEASSAASSMRHVVVRYPGSGGWYGLRAQSSLLDARAIRVEHAQSHGFFVSDLGYGADWAAWNGNADGIRLDGGTFLLDRCTAANNASAGIRDAGGFTGVVSSSVAFGNGFSNILGFGSAELRYSNGDSTLAGTNGNIDADPLFVNAANGDLTLAAGSPCIEAGDPLDFPGAALDMTGVARALDGDFDKDPRVDMGAYEFSHVRLDVTGTFQPGGTLTFTSTGTPGLVSYLFLATDTGALLFYPYGTLLVDPLASFVFVPWPGPPANPSFVVPNFLPTPQPVAVQQIVFQGSTAGGGNLSNVEYFVIDA